MSVLAFGLLGVGVATGVLGLLGDNEDLTWCGIFLTVTTVPLVITRSLRRNQQVSEEQLAKADMTGYLRALDHVARGLLDQHTAPPDSGNRAEGEQPAGNVISLRPTTVRNFERKAQ
ncbi:hypothetical protein ACFWOB_42720 [Streptomyces sp. NPDC058420]|uniref:hypothetical protein n=1 Tax=Streptomyces sp. NPDC058420 TaxID=3346489 RepID=UPI003668472C